MIYTHGEWHIKLAQYSIMFETRWHWQNVNDIKIDAENIIATGVNLNKNIIIFKLHFVEINFLDLNQ